MKIKPTYMLSEIEGRNIVITVGDGADSFNGYLTLNESSAFLWRILESGATEEELVEALASRYSIPAGQAKEDVGDFLDGLRDVLALEE